MNPPATVMRTLPKLTTLLMLAIALFGLEIPAASANETENKPTETESLADGTYLYGETPQPNQIMRSYVVFQKQQGKIVGAVYYPRADFQCFSGSIKNNTLDVKLLNPEEQKTGSKEIELFNLHQIKHVTGNDQRIVSVCKQETVAIASR